MSADAIFWITTAALVAAIGPTILGMTIDGRLLDRDKVWVKPLKFELSLAIHFATLGWLAGYLPQEVRSSGLIQSTAWAAAAATLFEMSYMSIQAARRRRSHFNVETPIEATMYSLMALGAVVITVAAGIVGAALLVSETPAIRTGLKAGGGFGLVLGTILILITAFGIGGAMSRHNGVERTDATRMPMTGWSTTVADRRIPHFFATHLMQALPVFGWACDRVLPSSVTLWLVLTFGVVYSVCTLLIFRAINRGEVIVMKRISAR